MEGTMTIVYAILSGCSITMIYIGRHYLGNMAGPGLIFPSSPSLPRLPWLVNFIGSNVPWLASRERVKTYGDIVYSRLFPESLLAFISSLITNIKTWFICSLLDILATGPTPRHIAFEMDGNRRYARRLGMQSKDGHAAGYEALYQVLEFCKRLRIHYVTVYAFAIENFNRPKEEVDSLMELMREKLIEIAEDLGKRGLRLNVLGRRELLPPAVQEAVEYAENLTRHNNVLVVNICAPYTSQDEITTAVESVIREAIDAGDFDGSTITENTINSHLSTSLVGSPPLDIFVRTSGVKRLSGFLLWQCCEHTQMHMVDACWPDFGPFHLLAILLDYQRKVWAEARR